MLVSWFLSLTLTLVATWSSSEAFEWAAGGARPEVTRQAIAGLWRLTPQPSYPLKEFTVYPKPKKKLTQQQEQALLLMLKEDGSFQQYSHELGDDDDEDKEGSADVDVNDQWSRFLQKEQTQQQQKQQTTNTQSADVETASKDTSTPSNHNDELTHELVKGVWDYRDGKLILAADRPEDNPRLNDNRPKQEALQELQQQQQQKQRSSQRPHLDKLIVGRVVATYETSLQDNPMLQKQQKTNSSSDSQETMSTMTKAATPPETDTPSQPNQPQTAPSSSSSAKSDQLDAHLNIPRASLKVGKFFYPKTHPSFFEQPIYNPTTANRRFQLKQVLGALNTAKQDEPQQQDPTFERWHFYNKTFLLSSHPLQQRRPAPRDDLPWMPQKKKRNKPESINPHAEASPIRVMQLKFFSNNTFATVWGTGQNILRGRFDLFKEGTQLWMQVLRFGFGRSVSGSCYSEGPTLTHDDAKTYWGTIRQVNVTTTTTTAEAKDQGDNDDDTTENDDETVSILEVEGSVMFGRVGTEPEGRFLMREMMRDDLVQDNDDDDDDDDDNDEILDASALTALFEKDASDDNDEAKSNGREKYNNDGVDWSTLHDDDDAFQ